MIAAGTRLGLLALLVTAAALIAVDTTHAQPAPVAVVTGTADQWGASGEGIDLAWSSNGATNTGPYNAYVRVGSGPIGRVNPAGTQASAGGQYVHRLIYQQIQNGHAIMRFYNVVTHAHGVVPAAWNRGVWQQDPTFFTHYVLFGRYTPAIHRWAILLGDLITHDLKLLASVTGVHAEAHAGQVNGDYATWTVCHNVDVGCDVYEYTISTGITTKLANTFSSGAYQYSSSVSRQGTVYFFHSNGPCGGGVTLNEQELGPPRKVLVALAPGVGVTLGRRTYLDDSHVTPVVYYSATRCGTHQDDTYKVVNGSGPSLVKDIWPGRLGSGPGPFTHMPGGYLLFSAFVGGLGSELYRTDGTEAATRLVKDINPGPGSSFRGTALAVVGGIAYLSATDGRHGIELWRSDGSAAGTRLVKDLYPAPRKSSSPHDGLAFAGDVYFVARDANGFERWKSDGTAAGTTIVKGTAPLSAPVTVGGRLYFAAASPASGTELWTSDSRGAGMRMVADINPGPASSSPQNLVAYDGDVYLQACDTAHGCEVWRSNGTPAGTTLVNDTVPGTTGAGFSDGTVMGGTLYFVAEDSHGQQLWRTDGAAAGTVRVTGLSTAGPLGDEIDWVRTVGSTIYFEGYDQAHGQELWSTSGTPNTEVVTDILPGPGSSSPGSDGLAVVDGVLLFNAGNPVFNYELWQADGTPGGIHRVADLHPGPVVSSPSDITPLNGVAIFSASYPFVSYELFRYTP